MTSALISALVGAVVTVGTVWFASAQTQRSIDQTSRQIEILSTQVTLESDQQLAAHAQEIDQTDSPGTQLVGVYGLTLLARDKPDRYRRVTLDILTNYLRGKIKAKEDPSGNRCDIARTLTDDTPDGQLLAAWRSIWELYQAEKAKPSPGGKRYTLTLTGMCLGSVNFGTDDLQDVDFSDSVLSAVDLTGKNMSCAKARWTQFYDVVFSGTRLFGTDLTGAFIKANLPGTAAFTKVDLRQAKLGAATFAWDEGAASFIDTVDDRQAEFVFTDPYGKKHPTSINLEPVDERYFGKEWTAPYPPVSCDPEPA